MQEGLVTERKEKPVSMNAFELISRSQSFNLENLFEKQAVRVIRFSWFSHCQCLATAVSHANLDVLCDV